MTTSNKPLLTGSLADLIRLGIKTGIVMFVALLVVFVLLIPAGWIATFFR